MDQAEARVFGLLVAAVARIGTGTPPEQLMAEGVKYVPFFIHPPARMSLALEVGEEIMPLTVDSANAVAVLSFTDDHNDPVAPPAGAVATATSSNESVLTVGAATPGTDANGVANIQFPLTEVAAGTSTLSVTTADASGNPLMGPNGTTPIPTPPPVDVTVTPGAPAAEIFTVPGN